MIWSPKSVECPVCGAEPGEHCDQLADATRWLRPTTGATPTDDRTEHRERYVRAEGTEASACPACGADAGMTCHGEFAGIGREVPPHRERYPQ